jgi:hypothetical protein
MAAQRTYCIIPRFVLIRNYVERQALDIDWEPRMLGNREADGSVQ